LQGARRRPRSRFCGSEGSSRGARPELRARDKSCRPCSSAWPPTIRVEGSAIAVGGCGVDVLDAVSIYSEGVRASSAAHSKSAAAGVHGKVRDERAYEGTEREALRAQGLRMREEIEPLRESLESERCLREQAEADTSRLQGQAQAAEEHLTTAQGTVARLQKELEDARATHGVAKAADAPEEERTPARTTDDDTLAGVFDAELPLPADSTDSREQTRLRGRLRSTTQPLLPPGVGALPPLPSSKANERHVDAASHAAMHDVSVKPLPPLVEPASLPAGSALPNRLQ